MKHLYKILGALLLAYLYAPAQIAIAKDKQIKSDTLLNITVPARMIITENDKGMRVVVEGSGEDGFTASTFTEYTSDAAVKTTKNPTKKDWIERWADGNITKIREGKSWWDFMISGVAIGLVNPINQAPTGGLQWSKSIEICWMSCIGVKYGFAKQSSISLGLGFDWRNYKITTSDRCLVSNDNKGIEWGSYPDGSKGKNSRLKVFSLQFPLIYSWYIPKSSLIFKCGPVLNFNTYASLKTAYEDASGNKIEDFTKSISARRFTVDFFGSLSYNSLLGVYVRFSPMKVIDSPSTLNFQPLSVGVTFGI